MIKILLYISLSLLFIGCSPKYKIEKTYIYSQDINMQNACFIGCKNTLSLCQDEYLARYNSCMQEANKRAKEIYNTQMLKFQNEYNLYRLNLHSYDINLQQYRQRIDYYQKNIEYFSQKCSNNDNFACQRLAESKIDKQNLESLKPIKPLEPKRVSLDEILKIQTQGCIQENICQNEYDSCFKSCGGSIVTNKVCVENCD